MPFLKKSNILWHLLLWAIALSFSSCAAIISGSQQNIRIKTEPKGALVFINGQNTYKKTPCKVKVKRRQKRPLKFRQENKVEITVKKEGFQDSKLIVASSFNVVSVPSIFFAGVPFLVDLMVGAHLKYPRNNFLALEPTLPEVKPPLRLPDDLADEHSPLPDLISDIAMDIPQINRTYPNKFALIIGNEHYSNRHNNLPNEVDVSFAVNDASLFMAYANKTLGIPTENIIFITDATQAQMKKGIHKLNLLAQAYGTEAELLFYYAGHGLPHPATSESYLLPIDLTGNDIDLALKLDDVYLSLSEHPSQKVTCVLDCCFSGGARNKEIVQARGVKVVPKIIPVTGNMVVFAASSGNQTAHAHSQMKHGLYTYYFLKKLKENKGNVTMGEMQNYLKKEVSIQSILLNDKPQYPQIVVSPQINEAWKNWRF